MIDINDLAILTNRKEEENYRFRNYLKSHADEKKLDKQFKRLHDKYFKIYDCKKCRNCYKTIGISMDLDELNAICNYLKIDKEKFCNDNLIEKYGEYSFKELKCKFLDKLTIVKLRNVCLELARNIHILIKKKDYLFYIVLLLMLVFALLYMKY